MRIQAPPAVRQHLLCAIALGLVFLSAPFPRLQAVVHVVLVLALAPRVGSPLTGVLWAAAGGWAVEGTLRLYPHMGGTAWADMTFTLLAGWMAGRWPLEGVKGWLARLAGLVVAHTLVAHLAVRLAAGPHAWGSGWFWSLLSLPLWGWAVWRVLYAGPSPRRG
jgi:hypothetical protein